MRSKRQRRLMMVAFLLLGIGAAAALALNAFQKNLLFFYSLSAGKLKAQDICPKSFTFIHAVDCK